MVDTHCIVLAQSGDKKSWQKIINAYKEKIYNLLARFTKDHWEMDDIYQEVWLRVYSKIHLYNHKYTFSSWIIKVTANVALNYQRKNKWARFLKIDYEPTTNTKMSYSEFIDEIQRPLSTLSPQARMVFLLYHYESYSAKEIAQMLDMPVGTVKSHLSRSAKSLQQLFSQERKQ